MGYKETKEWRLKNPEKFKLQQKRYQSSERARQYQIKYHQEHKAEIYKKVKKWRISNPEKYKKQWKKLSKSDKIIEWRKKYYKKNIHKWIIRSQFVQNNKNIKIKCHLRTRLNYCFKRYIKTKKIYSSKKYGINFLLIVQHLKPFPEDLSKYHIDHIRPLCSFTFIKEDGSTDLGEIQKAFAPENHQWLLAEENMSKGGRWKK